MLGKPEGPGKRRKLYIHDVEASVELNTREALGEYIDKDQVSYLDTLLLFEQAFQEPPTEATAQSDILHQTNQLILAAVSAQ